MFLALEGEQSDIAYEKISHAPLKRYISGERVFVAHNKHLIEQGDYFYAFSHRPQHSLRLPPDTFTVTCLRNPVNRVISHYKMIMEYKKLGKPFGGMEEESRWFEEKFSEFLENIPKSHLLSQLYMFSKSYNTQEAFENIVACSHHFVTEGFSTGVEELAKKTGIMNLKPIHVRRTEIAVEISEKDILNLTEMLKPEIDLYHRLAAVSC